MRFWTLPVTKWSQKAKRGSGLSPEPLDFLGRRYWIGTSDCRDDATTEGLTDALVANRRGILWNRNEMAGFILDSDRYIQRDAGTKTRLMSSYDSGPWNVNRKDKTKNSFIRHATLSILGSIQPAGLPQIFSSLDAASGFLPRFFFIWAVRETPPFRTEATVSRESQDFLTKLFDRLLQLDFREDDEPLIIRLSDPAREVFIDWFNVQAAEPWFQESTQIFEALLAKLRGQCLRICLILHCLESAASGTSELRSVSLSTMEKAIRLANCLKIHQTNTWRFILSEGAVLQLTPMEKRVVRAILHLESKIEGGMLPTARITKVVNLGMTTGFRFYSSKVGKIASGLGYLNFTALRYLGSEGKGMPKIQGKITFLRKVVLLFRRRKDSASRTKEQKLWDIFPGPKGPKNYFLTAAAKVAA